MNTWTSPDTNHIRGRTLRFLITRELERAARPMTVPEIIKRLEGYGFTILGRSSKTVSDSLRWEIAKRRLRRLKRGVYAYQYAPPSTLRRIKKLSQTASQWIVAMTRTTATHPTVSRARSIPKPWDDYHWLWKT